MRTWLYNKIRVIPSLPSGIADRVISAGAADNPVRPFMVLVMGLEDNPLGSTPEMSVQNIPFTVWVHDAPGSMIMIDEAARLVKDHLTTEDGAVVGGMSVYNIRWAGTGEDAYDDHYKTNCRPVRFTMMTRSNG